MKFVDSHLRLLLNLETCHRTCEILAFTTYLQGSNTTGRGEYYSTLVFALQKIA